MVDNINTDRGIQDTVSDGSCDVHHRTKHAHSNQGERMRIALGVSDEVAAVEGLSVINLIALGKNGVKSLDDLADLANDELIEIVGAHSLTREAANEIIMTARSRWFVEADPTAKS